MKTPLLFVVLVMCFSVLPGQAMIENFVRINGVNAIATGFNDYRSDSTPNATTVRFTLVDNPARKRWEFRVWNWQTGSQDLTAGLDVTIGTDIQLQFQKFPNGHPQGVRSFYLQGTDLRDLDYRDTTDTIDLKIRPVKPARTVGHSSAHTAALGIDFYYRGEPTAPIDYSPPVIIGTLFLEDVGRAQHPSSELLNGRAIRVDGIQGEEVLVKFLFGSTYGNARNFDINTMGGYLDGVMPSSGFSASTPAAPSFSVNMGIAGEQFRTLDIRNLNFSAHDIQAGIFRAAPVFTKIERQPTGMRVFWSAATNQTYTLQSFNLLGGATNVVATNLTESTYFDSTISTNPARYYRLLEE